MKFCNLNLHFPIGRTCHYKFSIVRCTYIHNSEQMISNLKVNLIFNVTFNVQTSIPQVGSTGLVT